MKKINLFSFKLVCFVTYYTLLSLASFAVLLSLYQDFIGAPGDGREIFSSAVTLILLCVIVKRDLGQPGLFESKSDN